MSPKGIKAIALRNQRLEIERMLRKARKSKLIDDYADLLHIVLEQLTRYRK